MIQRIKTWFVNKYKNYKETQRRKQVLEDIKKAKQIFVEGRQDFMCWCFVLVDGNKYGCYNDIHKRIPEFHPTTFGFCIPHIYGGWWPISDRESRIKAFDKLIEIYSK